jgi:hypothetical protein
MLPNWLLLLPIRPAALAESVFDGVKAKMRNLRAALATKDNMLQAAKQVTHLQALSLQPDYYKLSSDAWYMPLQTHHT